MKPTCQTFKFMAVIASNIIFFRHQASDDADAQKRNVDLFFYKCQQNGALENSQRGSTSVPMDSIQDNGDFRNRKINSTASWQLW